MAFNLHQFKKETTDSRKRVFHRHLIVGEDLLAVELFYRLRKKLGEENVIFLCSRPLVEEDLRLFGPSMVRGEANIAVLKEILNEESVSQSEKTSKFFKELKFRKFGGRSKPEPLLYEEEFFISPAAHFPEEEVFSVLKDSEFLGRLNDLRMDKKLVSLDKTTPTDLVDQANFELSCSDGTVIECEKLYWAASPQMFLNQVNNKNSLSDDFIQFCEQTHAPAALYIRFDFESAITEMNETVFVPLSYTHEWGHFIGEFSCREDGSQTVEFVSFLDPDQTNEEFISKKIRILRRNLEKIYPLFITTKRQEFIRLDADSARLKIDDELFAKAQKELPNLRFVNANAPLGDFAPVRNNFEYSKSDISFVARGIKSLMMAESSL